MIKNIFTKELVMTREDDDVFENSNKCCICDNVYAKRIVKIRDNLDMAGNYIDSSHRDSNIKIKFRNHKTPILFYKLKNYDSYHFMQELRKFNFKINFILKMDLKTYEL